MDWELVLLTGFILLASAGLLCSGLAAYHYVRWERSNETPRLPVAMAAFALQYGFVFVLAGLSSIVLDANPLENIANTKKISSVMMRGTVYKRVQLDDLLNRSAKIASDQK